MIPRSLSRAARAARRDLATAWSRDVHTFRRRLLGIDRRTVRSYLDNHQVRRLHLSCGRNVLPGWLNTDFYPRLDSVIHLDARGRFPFDDVQFDCVFSEHMIEHIGYADAVAMLKECFRVLKPGGRVRISTPDLAFLVGLWRDDRSALQDDYVRWATEKFVKDAPRAGAAFVINNFVRRWGHLFIHDEATLRGAFADAGFISVERRNLNESDIEALRGLENEKRMPKGFLQLETMTLEGTRP